MLGLVLFASVGYVESVISFIGDFGTASARLTMERGFLYSSIPYALYGIFLIVYFLRFPMPVALEHTEPSAEFLSKYGITEREREIIVKVMQGKGNEEIARELVISLATVKTHLHNIEKTQRLCARSIRDRIMLFFVDFDQRSKCIQQSIKRMFLIIPNFIQ